MGKTDNIKRAKRLKEAKRQRERETFITTGQGPAAIALKKRIESMGGQVLMNQGPVKYSELLESFANFILEDDDNIDMIRFKLMFAVHVWNCAIIRETNEERYLELKNQLADTFNKMSEAEELFDEMVQHKQEEFLDYKNLIVDFEVKMTRANHIELSVTTIPYDAAK